MVEGLKCTENWKRILELLSFKDTTKGEKCFQTTFETIYTPFATLQKRESLIWCSPSRETLHKLNQAKV